MAKSEEKKIWVFNLLKPVAVEETAWDRVYDWLITRARIILFVVEILIVFAFISKFIVDTQAKNKEKTIETLQAEETFYSQSVESEFRLLQAKSQTYTNLWSQSSSLAGIMEEVYSYLPSTVEQIVIRVTPEEVTVEGYENLAILEEIENSFRQSDSFSDAQIALVQEAEDIESERAKYSVVGQISAELVKRPSLNGIVSDSSVQLQTENGTTN